MILFELNLLSCQHWVIVVWTWPYFSVSIAQSELKWGSYYFFFQFLVRKIKSFHLQKRNDTIFDKFRIFYSVVLLFVTTHAIDSRICCHLHEGQPTFQETCDPPPKRTLYCICEMTVRVFHFIWREKKKGCWKMRKPLEKNYYKWKIDTQLCPVI